MTTTIIRNGAKLCAKCRSKGCESYIGGAANDESDYVSDEPCDCCEFDVTIEDEFGL